ncbi:MAG: hypothetical protein KDC61_08345 [Saprospiraceae bacterium]|nr:hypothetical protein [Saprospiraceae bacterium]
MASFNLFAQIPGYALFDKVLEDLTKEIKGKQPDYILNVDPNEWEEYFVNKYSYMPLTIYPSKAIVEFNTKRLRPVERFGRQFEQEEFEFNILIPYTGSSFLFQVQPSTYVMRTAKVDVPTSDAGNITMRIVLHEQDPKLFEREKNSLITLIDLNIKNINKDVEAFNRRIVPHYHLVLNAEIERIKKERSFFEAINVKIDKGTEQIFKAPVISKKRIPEPIIDANSSKGYIKAPTFPDNLYSDVLNVVYTFFKNVEKKPSIYQNKDEEGLRDYLLPLIETRYIGTTVTGETFNKGGKTDILLKFQDGSNLFVAECKFWKGKVQFHDTINQLFDRYLTWRDSKVAIIFFVKNKDFSAVLSTIKESVSKHPYFFRENGTRGESSFSYLFHFPNDSQKLVYTEIMAFAFNQ